MSGTHTWSISITAGGTSGICQWITDHGGTHGINYTDCFSVVQAWLTNAPLPPPYSFIPSFNDAFGVVQYWIGDYAGGNSTTGCGT